MKTFSAVIVLAAILVVPASAAAKSKDPDERDAVAQCKSERGTSKASHRAFKAKHHSFRRCTRQSIAATHALRRTAAKDCKAEAADEEFPATHEDKSFEDFYGTNHNRRNAFGKCVSTKVDEQEGDDEADDPVDEDDHQGKCDDEHGSGHEQGDDESEPDDD